MTQLWAMDIPFYWRGIAQVGPYMYTFKFFPSMTLAPALFALAVPAFATVTVTSPANGAAVTSPVHYVATATTSTCSKGVASMGIYIDNKLTYVVDSTSLNTSLTFNPGSYDTVVEEWDKCGGATYTPINITVSSSCQPAGCCGHHAVA